MAKFAFLLSALLASLAAGTSEGRVVQANFRESLVRYDTDSGGRVLRLKVGSPEKATVAFAFLCR